MIHLTSADYRIQPWANGRGTTTEMLRETDAAGAVTFRLSMAVVAENGPFSIFPGIARNLTVLTGPGFTLRGEGLLLHAKPLEPVTFPGDLAVMAEGVSAPSTDFNVMSATLLPRPQVWCASAGEALPAGAILFALQPTTLAGRVLAKHDLMATDQPTSADQPMLVILRSGRMAAPSAP